MFTAWYEDDFGISKTTIFKPTEKEAESYFKNYYKKYNLISIIKQTNMSNINNNNNNNIIRRV